MDARTTYIRSALGAFIMSPLGARICNTYLTITVVPVYLEDATAYGILGNRFGATQGSGTLIIGNTPDLDDVAITQTVTTWADDEITFTFDAGALISGDPIWVKVTSDNGQSDTAITQLDAITDIISISADNINGGSTGTGTTPGFNIFCGLGPDYYCFAFFDDFQTQLDALGYYPLVAFSITGETSLKSVEFGEPDHEYTIVSTGYEDARIYCGVEGLSAGWASISSGVYGLVILYETLTSPASCASNHGWDSGETVVLVPRYPLSIYITSPIATEAPTYTDITLTAYSYAAEGDISGGIEWWVSVDGAVPSLYYTGATTTITIEGDTEDTDYTFYARSTNANGQARQATISVAAVVPIIDGYFPLFGNSAGGQRVTFYGSGFHSSTEIIFDGNAATGETITTTTVGDVIQCVTPSGTDSVIVEAVQGGWTNEALDTFEYIAAENILILSVTPNTGAVAGGDTVTIVGTGFTADCVVYFHSGFDDLYLADNIIFTPDDQYYASDFSAGVDGWAATNGTATGNVDGVELIDDCLELEVGASGAVSYLSRSASLVVGVPNHLLISVFVPSGQTYVDGFRVYAGDNTTGTLLYTGTASAGAWVDVDIEETPTYADLRVYAYDGTSATINAAASGELLYVTLVSVQYASIECDTPLWDQSAGVISVRVADEVSGAGDILVNGFEYT